MTTILKNTGPPNPEREQEIRNFLDGSLGISQDLDIASLRMHQRLVARSELLSDVISQLDFSPWRLRISGAAGCGKTVLAQKLFREALKAGQKALYLCFNRPLADGVACALKAPQQVMTIDRFTEHYPLDTPFNPARGQDAFEGRRADILASPLLADWQFDLVVVDEGQDFSSSQRQLAERLVKEGGRFIWLDDQRQQLYSHNDGISPSCTTTLTLRENYRTAQNITRYMNTLLGLDPADIPAAAVEGTEPAFHVVGSDTETMTDAIAQ